MHRTRIGDPIRPASEEDYLIDIVSQDEESGVETALDLQADFLSGELQVDIDREDGAGWVSLGTRPLIFTGDPINRAQYTWTLSDIDLQGSVRGKLRITVSLTNAAGQVVRAPHPLYEEVLA